MSDPSANDGHTINVGPVTVHDDRERTHFYGDGCDDDHGQTHILVWRIDYEALVDLVDGYDDDTVIADDVVVAARRLIERTTERDDTGPDDGAGGR